MSASKLSKPNLIYKNSFLEALQEYHEEDRYTFLNLNELNANFEEFHHVGECGRPAPA